jgi:hypothetical protein
VKGSYAVEKCIHIITSANLQSTYSEDYQVPEFNTGPPKMGKGKTGVTALEMPLFGMSQLVMGK